MKEYLGVVTALFLVIVLMAGCTGLPVNDTSKVTGESANFRLLLSDDANAIDDFESVMVTVTDIGFQRGGESGEWIEPEDFTPWTGELKGLIGANATEIWEGYIDPGEYTKAFIYVDNITGNLIEQAGGGVVSDIKIPSGKLQISKPFTVTGEGENLVVDFVFDITIIKAGKSGQYLVKPQIAESGPDQEYSEVAHEEKQNGSTEEIKFKGTITAIIDENTWTVKIGDEERTVNVEDATIEGEPAVGLKAKIEGRVGEDNIIVASEVETKEAEEEETD